MADRRASARPAGHGRPRPAIRSCEPTSAMPVYEGSGGPEHDRLGGRPPRQPPATSTPSARPASRRTRRSPRRRSGPSRSSTRAARSRCPGRRDTRIFCVSNQKGGVGKTTTRRQHRGRAGPARQPGPGHRPGPAGQRLDRTGRPAPLRHPGRVRLPGDRDGHLRRGPGGRGHPEPVVRAGHDRPRRRRDRAGLDGRPGVPPAPGARGAQRARTTTSSSTARRRWAC